MLQMVEIITRSEGLRTSHLGPPPAKTPSVLLRQRCPHGSLRQRAAWAQPAVSDNRPGESTDLRFVLQLQPEGSCYGGGGSDPHSIPRMDSRHVTSMQMWLQLFLHVFNQNWWEIIQTQGGNDSNLIVKLTESN